MELEDLKIIWKQRETEFRPKDESEIGLMLRGRSMSIIAKLKRSVWFELITVICLSVVLLIYAISLKAGALKWTAVSMLVSYVAATIYFVKKLSLLNRFQVVNENLRDTVRLLIVNMTGYLRFYKNSYAILYPVYFFLAILFGALERGPKKYMDFLLRPETIIHLLLVAVIFFLITNWFANWYIKKLYGNHLAKLQGLLDDLEEN
jgi:hypothetical protein